MSEADDPPPKGNAGAASGPGLSSEMSTFLDAVRFLAALTVMLGHATARQLGGAWIHIPFLGYVSVMIFFVLSGFVIAYVVDEKRETFRTFIASRLARLCSALWPALLLTAAFDMAGRTLNPGVYQGWDQYMSWSHPVLELTAAALFLNQLWFSSIAALSNAPVWSLGFEFWYYILFAWLVFTRGWTRIFLVAATCAFVGPKILGLLPVWFMGVWCWRAVRSHRVNEPTGWALFLGASALFMVLFAVGTGWKLRALELAAFGPVWFDRFGYAAEIPWAWILGVLTATAFFGFANVAHRAAGVLARLSRPIRFGADISLSLYLVHLPTLMLASAVLSGMKVGPLRTGLSLLAALVVSTVFSYVFERRRGQWKRALLKGFGYLGWRGPSDDASTAAVAAAAD